MLNSASVLISLVNKYRTIPELVQEMGGDPANLMIFRRRWPHDIYLPAAYMRTPAPCIIFASEGGPALTDNASLDPWVHKFVALVRPREESADLIEGEVDACERIYWLMVNGVPQDETASGNKMLNEMIRSDCHPISALEPRWEPLAITPEAVIDCFSVRISINEIGDN